MVAIVSGNTLGLNRGSLAVLGEQGQIGGASQGRSGERIYVNAATGNLVLQDRDGLLNGLGPDAHALRTYNSQGSFDFDNNDNWLGSSCKSLKKLADGSLLRTDVDGSTSQYVWNATQKCYLAAQSSGAALDSVRSNADGTLSWTHGASGKRETYQGSGAGLLLSEQDTSGNTLSYSYTAEGLLSEISTADGERIRYSYTGRNISQISTTLESGKTLQLVSYTYDAQDRLSSVSVNLAPDAALPANSESAETYLTQYRYDGSSTRITSVRQSDGSELTIGYTLVDGSYRVSSMTDALGHTTRLSYNTGAKTVTVTDAQEVSTLFRYDNAGRLTQVRYGVTAGSEGLSQKNYTYTALGEVQSIDDGIGHVVSLVYDASGNLISQTDKAGNTHTNTYNAQNQLLTETVYVKPAVGTTAAYQPLTKRYVYDAGNKNLLRFEISAEGRVSEYRYNALGQQISELAYAGSLYGISALAQTAVPTEAQMVTWAASQDVAQAQRTDYSYDVRGQLASTTRYPQASSTGQSTHYVYNQNGQLIQTLTPDLNGVTDYLYDGLGRIVSAATHAADNSLSTTTLTQYDDAHGQTTVVLANGLKTVSSYDKAGRLISVLQTSSAQDNLGTTRYFYDEAGRLLMRQDATGQRNWHLYDAAGRKTADIDATGALTEYVYNADNQITQTIAYATRVDINGLVDADGRPTTGNNFNAGATPLTLATLRPASDALDQKNWNFYDDAQRLAWQVDALGYVTQTQYDGADRAVSVTRLSTPVDTQLLGDGNNLVLQLGKIAPRVQLSETILGSGPNALRQLNAVVSGVSTYPYFQGTVSFYAGQTCLGSAKIDEIYSGKASLTVRNLPLGDNAVTAVFSGDTHYLSAISNVVADTVSAATATTTVLSVSQQTTTGGTAVRLNALVGASDPQGNPGSQSGTVSFYDGDVLLGTGALSNGAASLLVTNLAVGSHALRAVYDGDDLNARSVSESVASVIDLTPTRTELYLSAPATDPGSYVVLNATVVGLKPTGTVRFYNGASLLGEAAVIDGMARITLSSLPSGTAELSAVYAGDGANRSSGSEVVSETVRARSQTQLSATRASTDANAAITVRATVSGANPGGTVVFYKGSSTTALGSATVLNGVATFVIENPQLDVSEYYYFSAAYSGDALNARSAVYSTYFYRTSLAIVATPPAPILPASSLSLVSGSALASGSGLSVRVAGTSPTGQVTFLNGNTILGVAEVIDGVATLNALDLSAATYNLSAIYTGDANNAASTLQFSQAVTLAPSSTKLTVSAEAVTQGTPVTLTARVGGPGPFNVNSYIYFYAGSRILGSAYVLNGIATLTTTQIPIGFNQLTASHYDYQYDAPSTSAAVSVTVTAQACNVSVSTSSSSVAQGSPLTLTASVRGNQPSGTVIFLCGQTVLGSAYLDYYGVAKLSLDRVNLPVGANPITVSYTGDANNPTTQSAALVQTVVAGSGTVKVVTDPLADRAAYRLYDHDGLLRAEVDSGGFYTEYSYNGAGQVVQKSVYTASLSPAYSSYLASWLRVGEADGYFTGAQYFAKGASDQNTYYFCNSAGQQVGEIDAEGYLREYLYNDNGQLTQTIRYATKVSATITATAALSSLRPAASAQDQITTQSWDALGRLQRQTNAEGTVTEYRYDALGQLLSSTVALGTSEARTLSKQYDLQGNVVAELSAEGAALLGEHPSQETLDAIWAQYAIHHRYDAAGRLTSTTDQNGARTVFFYDEVGQLRYSVNAEGEVSETDYDALGHVRGTTRYASRLGVETLAAMQGGILTASAANRAAAQALQSAGQTQSQDNRYTRYDYDAKGRLIDTRSAAGNETELAYNSFDEVIRSVERLDSAGATRSTTYAYDRRGARTQSIEDAGGLNLLSKFEVDAFGRVTKITDAAGRIRSTQYDRLGRVIQTTDPANKQALVSYDAFDRVLTQTDVLGNVTRYRYDDQTRSVSITSPEGITVTTQHDHQGQTQRVIDGQGNTTTYQYDANGQLLQSSNALAEVHNEYDAGGRLIASIDGKGVRTEYHYDAANRLLTRVFDPAGLALRTTYQYDALGQTTLITDPSGQQTRLSYDLAGHVVYQSVDAADGGLGLETRYRYDLQGNTVSLTSAAGVRTDYQYDALGRRTQEVIDPEGLRLTRSFEYDSAGNMVNAADANGNLSRYFYDANDRLVCVIDPLGRVQYKEYDAAGRLVLSVYDNTARDTSTWPRKLTYQELGYKTNVGYTGSYLQRFTRNVYDKDGRLRYTLETTENGGYGCTFSVREYRYDNNGNVLTQIDYSQRISDRTPATLADVAKALKADAQQDVYTRNVYDAANRLAWRVDGAGGVTHFIYDPVGNVVEQRRYAQAIDPTLLAPGQAPVVTADTSDARQRTVYDAANRPLYTVDGVGAVSVWRYDQDGRVVESMRYAEAIDPNTPAERDAIEAALGRLSKNGSNAHSWNIYDGAGRLSWHFESLGRTEGGSTTHGLVRAEQYGYDRNGNLVQKTQYAQALDVALAWGQDIDTTGLRTSAQDVITSYAYDAADRLVEQIDGEGNVQRNVYDANGRVVCTIQCATKAVLVEASGQRGWNSEAVQADPAHDRLTRMAYDVAGQLVYVVDATGAVLHKQYNNFGECVVSTRYAQRIDLQSRGQVLSVADIAALVVTGAADRAEGFVYDRAGRQIFKIDAEGYLQGTQYDAIGRVTATVLLSERRYGTYHNPNFYMTSHVGSFYITRPEDFMDSYYKSSYGARVETFRYDAAGHVVSSTDAMGVVTNNAYDGVGRQLVEGGAQGTAVSTRRVFDAAGRVIWSINGAGEVRSFRYDARGNLTDTIEYAQRVDPTQLAAGQVPPVQADAAHDSHSRRVYDADNRLIYTIDGMGGVTEFRYDSLGRLIERIGYATPNPGALTHSEGVNIVTGPSWSSYGIPSARDQHNWYVYDEASRVIWQVDGTGTATHYQYNATGEVLQKTVYAERIAVHSGMDAAAAVRTLAGSVKDEVTTYQYNRAGQICAEIDALGTVTRYERNAFGEAQTIVESSQSVQSSDPQALLEKLDAYLATVPVDLTQGRVTRQVFDAKGQLLDTIDISGALTQNTYDVLGRLIGKTSYTTRLDLSALVAPDFSVEGSRSTSAQAVELRKRADQKYGEAGTRMVFDSDDRLIWSVDATGYATHYAYDTNGNVVEVIKYAKPVYYVSSLRPGQVPTFYPDAANDRVTRNVYDAANRLIYSLEGLGASGKVTEYRYDGEGNRIERIGYAGLIAMSTPAQAVEIKRALAALANGGTDDVHHWYVYDKAHRLSASVDGSGAVTRYVYDGNGGLLQKIEYAQRIAVHADMNVEAALSTVKASLQDHVTTTVYDAAGRLTVQVDGTGAVTRYTYDTQGRVVITEQYAHTLDASKPQELLGRLDDLLARLPRDPAHDMVTRQVYDSDGRLIYTLDGTGALTQNTYDAAGKLTGTTLYKNRVDLSRSRGSDGAPLRLSLAEVQALVRPDSSGRMDSTTLYSYDSAGHLIFTIDPLGYIKESSYDATGHVTAEIQHLVPFDRVARPIVAGVTSETLRGYLYVAGYVAPPGKKYTYDAAGRVLTSTDQAGNIARYTYDTAGNLIRSTPVSGMDLGRYDVYDAGGRKTWSVNGAGDVTQYRYDSFDRVIEQIDYANRITYPQYLAAGQIPAVVADPAHDRHVRTVYDIAGNVLYTVDGVGAVTESKYDCWGNLVERIAYARPIAVSTVASASAISAALGKADVSGVATTVSASDVHERYVYDALNRLSWHLDGNGGVTHYQYDGAGHLLRKTEYANKLVVEGGQDVLTAVSALASSALDRVTTHQYDAAGHLSALIDAEGGVTRYVYDTSGRVVTRVQCAQALDVTDAQALLSHLDERLSGLAVDPVHDRVTHQAYDVDGRLIYTLDASGALTQNDYDAAGRLTGTTHYKNRIDLSKTRDTQGKPLSLVPADLKSLLSPDVAGMDRSTLYSYDSVGNLIYTIDPAGYVSENLYDAAGRLTGEIRHSVVLDRVARQITPGTSAKLIRDAIYVSGYSAPTATNTVYDAAGNVLSRRDAMGFIEYYSYNGLGDKLSFISKNCDGGGFYSGKASYTWNYEYDLAGRLIREIAPPVDQYVESIDAATGMLVLDAGGTPVLSKLTAALVTRMEYDALGNLTARTEAEGTSSARTTRYEYDALGHQILIRQASVSVAAEGATAEAQLMAMSQTGNAQVSLETYAPLTRVVYNVFGDAVANIDAGGNISYKAYDKLGRVRYALDNEGYVTGYAHNAFGEVSQLTRYAAKVSLNLLVEGLPQFSRKTVEDKLAIQHGLDRTLVTEYDGQGRAALVAQPAGWCNPGLGATQASSELSQVTRNTYDAFGELIRRDVLAGVVSGDGHIATSDAQACATTSHYYDLRGQEIATIDPLGYISVREYDVRGNLLKLTEGSRSVDRRLYDDGPSLVGTKITDVGDFYAEDNPYSVQANLGLTRTTEYTYDANDRKLSERVYGLGGGGDYKSTYQYDRVGNLIVTKDNGNNYSYNYYDTLGRLRAVASPLSSLRTMSYLGDYAGDLTQGSFALTEFKRDALGNVLVKTEYEGGANASQYSYQPLPGMGDRSTYLIYDSQDRVVRTRDAMGQVFSNAYNRSGQLACQWRTVTDFDGGQRTQLTAYTYDKLGRLVDTITPAPKALGGADGSVLLHTQTRYNAFGEVIARCNDDKWELGEFNDYDNAGRLWRSNSGDGVVKVYLYNVQGHLTAEITSAGQVSDGSHGSTGDADLRDSNRFPSARQVDELGIDGGVRRTDYQRDLGGNATQVQLPRRLLRNETLNDFLRPVVEQSFDRWGNLLSQNDLGGVSLKSYFTYNVAQQRVTTYQPDETGHVSAQSPKTTVLYDNLGRKIGETDANGHTNYNDLDAAGRVIREHHADGGVVSYLYNNFGEKVRMTDALGNATQFIYDKLGRCTSVISAAVDVYALDPRTDARYSDTTPDDAWVRSKKTGYAGGIYLNLRYDELGNKIAQTEGANSASNVDGTGKTTRYDYDLSGKLVCVTQPLGQRSLSAYDAQGKLISSQDANGYVASWHYDYFGRLESHTDLGGAAYVYTYDHAGQLVQRTRTDVSGQVQTMGYQYDGAGQTTQISVWDAGILGQTSTYTYDLAGRRVYELSQRDGTGLANTFQDQALSYDSLGRLSCVSSDIAGAPRYVAFKYDKAGNRLSQEIGNGTQSYTLYYAYDAMNRMILAEGAHNSDAKDLSNIQDASNPETGAHGHLLSYDLNGNRTSDQSWGVQSVSFSGSTPMPGNGHTSSYTAYYTSYNKVPGLVTHTYSYDKLNRLATEKVGSYIIDARYYDANSQVIQTGSLEAPSLYVMPDGSVAHKLVFNVYDDNGQLKQSNVVSRNGSVNCETQYSGSGYVVNRYGHEATYYTYDNAGNLTAYTTQLGGEVHYEIEYLRHEGYLQSRTIESATGPGLLGITTLRYDSNGYLLSVNDDSRPQNNRIFVNDLSGNVLRKYQEGNTLWQMVANGSEIGVYGTGSYSSAPNQPWGSEGVNVYTQVAEFDPAYRSIDAASLSLVNGQYPVSSGDSLKAIAQRLYGDSNLWYLIADANGLTGDRDLRVGQSLTIPSRIANSNGADDFRSFDTGKLIGPTYTNMPEDRSQPQGCSDAQRFVGVVIVAIVSYYGGSAGAAVATAFMTVMEQQNSPEGRVHSRDVARASAIAAAASYIGGSVGGGSSGTAAGQAATAVATAVATNAAIQAATVALGWQKNFHWKQVAAAGASAAVGQALGNAFGGANAPAGNTWTGFAENVLKGVATGVTRSLVIGGKLDWIQIAGDAFGNAIGSSIAETSAQTEARRKADPAGRAAALSLSFGDDVALRTQANGPDPAFWNQPYSDPGAGLGPATPAVPRSVDFSEPDPYGFAGSDHTSIASTIAAQTAVPVVDSDNYDLMGRSDWYAKGTALAAQSAQRYGGGGSVAYGGVALNDPADPLGDYIQANQTKWEAQEFIARNPAYAGQEDSVQQFLQRQAETAKRNGVNDQTYTIVDQGHLPDGRAWTTAGYGAFSIELPKPEPIEVRPLNDSTYAANPNNAQVKAYDPSFWGTISNYYGAYTSGKIDGWSAVKGAWSNLDSDYDITYRGGNLLGAAGNGATAYVLGGLAFATSETVVLPAVLGSAALVQADAAAAKLRKVWVGASDGRQVTSIAQDAFGEKTALALEFASGIPVIAAQVSTVSANTIARAELYSNAPTYVNLVSNFTKISASDVGAYYGGLSRIGANYTELIDGAILNYGMAADEAHAVFGYTTNLFYRNLNSALEVGGNAEATALSDLINRGIAKLPDSSAVQFRGLRLNTPSDVASFDGDFALGNTVTVKSYWSSGPTEADGYIGNRHILLNTEPGSAKDVSDLAFGVHFNPLVGKPGYSSEAVISPGVKFKVVDIDSRGRYILEQQ